MNEKRFVVLYGNDSWWECEVDLTKKEAEEDFDKLKKLYENVIIIKGKIIKEIKR